MQDSKMEMLHSELTDSILEGYIIFAYPAACDPTILLLLKDMQVSYSSHEC